MRKKLLGVLLCTAMVATMLTGCGPDSGSNGSSSNKSETKKVEVSDGGKVLNIRVWNEEFKSRVTDHYPGYEKVSETEGKIGDVTVKWTITPSDDNAYQNALDEALLKQDDAAADEKIDMFLVEADYALKYVDTDYTVDIVKDLGVSEDALSNQYKYTQDIVTDSNGALKGSSWQGCPAGMIYRRDIAKKVFGTDDPDKIQEQFKDWDAFKAASKKLKDAGYQTTATVNDTYRVFSNNVTSKWVEDNKINVDANIKTWVELSKEMVDNKETTTNELWSPEWSTGFMMDSNVFCYFGPAWFIDFSMGYTDGKPMKGSVVEKGGWALTVGPQSFYWGGTWICGANGTDNKSLVKDIIETMTANEDVLKDIVKKDSDYANHSALMDSLKNDKSFGDAALGGQNPIPIFADGIGKIDLSNTTSYDQTCTEEFQAAMKDYFDGNTADYDTAVQTFIDKVKTKHPEIEG
ncbi:MAG: carbohydrate ABC transporter substrate-binding protein [Lachnospiraceae bacterium]|nr:carbohydrate ABC transporter substrate-binding protein [Lachnospiraceae bacterium]